MTEGFPGGVLTPLTPGFDLTHFWDPGNQLSTPGRSNHPNLDFRVDQFWKLDNFKGNLNAINDRKGGICYLWPQIIARPIFGSGLFQFLTLR